MRDSADLLRVIIEELRDTASALREEKTVPGLTPREMVYHMLHDLIARLEQRI